MNTLICDIPRENHVHIILLLSGNLRHHERFPSLFPPRFFHVDGNRGSSPLPYGYLRLQFMRLDSLLHPCSLYCSICHRRFHHSCSLLYYRNNPGLCWRRNVTQPLLTKYIEIVEHHILNSIFFINCRCWLNGSNYKWSFAGPIAVIIIVLNLQFF